MDEKRITIYRDFLKDTLRLKIDFRQTDQHRGVPPPPIQKPLREGQVVLPLPKEESFDRFQGTDLLTAIGRRRSHRRFLDRSMTIAELALLLWATQGITEILAFGSAQRTVPSAGCRHAFETYLLVSNVEELDSGIYRYLPIEHGLVLESLNEDLPSQLVQATLGQAFITTAPVTFAWTAIPYRMEWRYDIAAHRVIAMDAGHLCQNLYLSCEAIGAGTCAIAAYHQEQMDRLLCVDGDNEFTVYLAPVGKV
jgi:SagB-type dehydrogenase family enzyme